MRRRMYGHGIFGLDAVLHRRTLYLLLRGVKGLALHRMWLSRQRILWLLPRELPYCVRLLRHSLRQLTVGYGSRYVRLLAWFSRMYGMLLIAFIFLLPDPSFHP